MNAMKSKLPFIHRGESGSMDFSVKSKNATTGYMYLFFAGVLIFFLVMISRLFQLTVVKGNYYRGLSEDNRIREVVIEAQRGKIVDRKGYVIAENSPVEVSETLKRITSKRYYSDGEVFAHILGYRQIADENDIAGDSCLHKVQLGDKVGKKGIERLYECELRGKNGKKLIEVNAQGLFKRTLSVVEPVPGDTMQLAIDSDLQKRAYEIIKGKKAVVVGLDPRTGEVLVLASSPSYDPQVFEDNKSKEIQALLKDETRPLFNRATEGTYPPGSVFKPVMALAALQEKIIDDESVVKDTGKVTLGNREFGTWNFLEHGQIEGDVDVVKALQRSNDIFFYKVAEKMGPEKMKKWAEEFGFQEKTGIGIDEATGLIPFPFWKEDVLKEQWYTGDTYNFSIGQGYVLTTPLQVALSNVPFANNGEYCVPSLLKLDPSKGLKKTCRAIEMDKEHLKTVREGMHQACKVGGTGWPLFTFRVKDPNVPTPTVQPTASASAAMNGVLTKHYASDSAVLGASESAQLAQSVAPSSTPTPTVMPIEKLWDPQYLLGTGSAYMKQTKAIEVGCKTGTAESGGKKKPHAWFTAFAPFDKPEILFAVLVEEDGQGSDRAAPIARELLRQYFETEE